MKKYIFFLVSLLTTIFSSSAEADVLLNPYLGIQAGIGSYEYTQKAGIDYSSIMPKNNQAMGFFLGFDINDYFYFEFGYDSTKAAHKATGGQYGIDSENSQIILMRYDLGLKIPIGITNYQILGIFGAVQGINSVKFTGATVNGAAQQGGYSFGYEYGIGVKKDFSQDIFGRINMIKQNLSFDGIANGGTLYSIGFGVKF